MKHIAGQLNMFEAVKNPTKEKDMQILEKRELKPGTIIKLIDNRAWFGLGEFEFKKGSKHKVIRITERYGKRYITIKSSENSLIALCEDRFVW